MNKLEALSTEAGFKFDGVTHSGRVIACELAADVGGKVRIYKEGWNLPIGTRKLVGWKPKATAK